MPAVLSRVSLFCIVAILVNLMYGAFLMTWPSPPWWAIGIGQMLAVLGTAGPALIRNETPAARRLRNRTPRTPIETPPV
jgi:hypothetical protein